MRQADFQRPVMAAQRGIATFHIVFAAAEKRQHLVVAPAPVAQGRPAVEIFSLATVVDQAVDGGGAAQSFALRQRNASARCSRRGLGAELPSPLRVEDDFDEAGGQMQVRVRITAPGFQQAHADAGDFAQARGHNRARCTAAHHHVIEHIASACTHAWAPR